MAPLLHYTTIVLQATDNMHINKIYTWLSAATAIAKSAPSVPQLEVPACPSYATIRYNRTVPDLADFPQTKVNICYSAQNIEIKFVAYNETNFCYNETYGNNDNIWEYEVMETFIAKGTEDPATYFEFEVAPNNVTFNAFIWNPSKVREDGADFERWFVPDPLASGIVAQTKLDKQQQTWTSFARIPLQLFDVDECQAKGTQWRMNFFRTVVSQGTFPEQLLGGWSPPNKASFHMTPFFGQVSFI
jgi:hypothetical protein